jgi:hypothetical protein
MPYGARRKCKPRSFTYNIRTTIRSHFNINRNYRYITRLEMGNLIYKDVDALVFDGNKRSFGMDKSMSFLTYVSCTMNELLDNSLFDLLSTFVFGAASAITSSQTCVGC